MLEVLRRQVLAQRVGVAVGGEHRLQACRRALGLALGEAAELGQHRAVHRQRIVGRKQPEPALGGFRVGQRVLDRLA